MRIAHPSDTRCGAVGVFAKASEAARESQRRADHEEDGEPEIDRGRHPSGAEARGALGDLGQQHEEGPPCRGAGSP